MKLLRLLAAGALTVMLLAGIGWLARAPVSLPGGEHGVLRLSWRLRGERVERCRTRTAAELARLPVHMRTPQECVGHLVAYRLRVVVDDVVLDSARVLPGGVRGDRPVFVLRDYPLPPGRHRVGVDFVREEARATKGVASLAFAAPIDVAPGLIELLTLDASGGALVHRRSPGR